MEYLIATASFLIERECRWRTDITNMDIELSYKYRETPQRISLDMRLESAKGKKSA